MRRNTKRMLLLSVLGVGVTALIADRMFFGVTDPAQAAALSPAAAPGEVASDAGLPAAESQEIPVPLVLAAAQASHGWNLASIPDPFKRRHALSDHAPAGQPDDPLRDAVAAFEGAHRVTAVVRGPASLLALVDGKPYSIGAEIADANGGPSGFLLREIREHSVIIELAGRPGLRFEVSLDKARAAKLPAPAAQDAPAEPAESAAGRDE